jgi:hypothetical protein
MFQHSVDQATRRLVILLVWLAGMAALIVVAFTADGPP